MNSLRLPVSAHCKGPPSRFGTTHLWISAESNSCKPKRPWAPCIPLDTDIYLKSYLKDENKLVQGVGYGTGLF